MKEIDLYNDKASKIKNLEKKVDKLQIELIDVHDYIKSALNDKTADERLILQIVAKRIEDILMEQ